MIPAALFQANRICTDKSHKYYNIDLMRELSSATLDGHRQFTWMDKTLYIYILWIS